MRRLNREDGQTFIEYTAVIACIIAALVAMQFYVKRALQGRLRSAADQIGEQYEPGKMSGSVTTTINRDISTEVNAEQPVEVEGKDGYATLRTEVINKDETIRRGTETVGPFE
jgi:Flp pilus assembly pilin Flp